MTAHDWDRVNERGKYTVRIEHGAIAHKAFNREGWVPTLWINGKQKITDYVPTVRAEAERQAALQATEEAQRYVGDYEITIAKHGASTPAEPPKAKRKAAAKRDNKRDKTSPSEARARRVLARLTGR